MVTTGYVVFPISISLVAIFRPAEDAIALIQCILSSNAGGISGYIFELSFSIVYVYLTVFFNNVLIVHVFFYLSYLT